MTTVMEVIAALGALTAFYALLRRDLGDVKRDLKGDIARVETRLDRHDGRFDHMEVRFDRLDGKIDTVRGELIAYLGRGTPPAV